MRDGAQIVGRGEGWASSAAGTDVVEIVGPRDYSAAEVCAALRISRLALRRYRLAGIAIPVTHSPGAAGGHTERYDYEALLRLRTAQRLMRDLGVNLAGAEVALRLLDQLAVLRAELDGVRAKLE